MMRFHPKKISHSTSCQLFRIFIFLVFAIPGVAAGDCHSVFINFVATRDVQVAITGYEQCLAEEAKPNPIIYFNLGVLYEAIQNWRLASQKFEQFLNSAKSTDNYVDSARNEISKIKMIQGRTEVPHYSSERDISVAGQLLKLGLSHEAELLAKRAATESGDFRAYSYAAIAEYQQHELDAASTDISKALAIAPPSQQMSLNALKAEIQKDRDIVRLCTAARAALKTDPKVSGDLYKAAWQIKPERTDIGFAAVLGYFGSSNPEAAMDILQKLSQEKDAYVSNKALHMRTRLGNLINHSLQKRQEANARFTDLLKHTRKDWSDIGSSDLKKLESSLRELLQLDPGNEAIRHRLAFILSREQKWPDAETEYQNILRINPQAKVNFWLARVLFKERKYDESQQALLESIQNPGSESPEIRQYLAEDLADKLKRKDK